MAPRNYRYAMKMSGRKFQPKALNKTARKQVTKIAKSVVSKSLETKFHDVSNVVYPSDTLGSVIPLTDIPQSTTTASDSTRIGDMIQPTSIDMRFVAAAGTLAGVTVATPLRVILVQWHGQTGNDNVTLAKILGAISYTAAQNPLRPYNHDNRAKFRVLYDKLFELGYNSDSIHVRAKKILSKMRPVRYYAGDAEDQMDGLYLVLQSSIDLAGVLPNFSYVIRTNFKDA